MTVEILGRTFTLKGSMPQESLQAVAREVDAQLRELQQAFPTRALSDLAILAALNLAYDCLESKEDHQQLQTEIETRSKQLIQILEASDSSFLPGP
ncbi:MAG: cell division protein ZapA [Proteobacteria bacterium]|nr:cell division protein ZapA [Pseudomonadota bacterium]MBU4356605.1 cell division protein ZapA [Pseudomonadota bacterium]MBU4448582.1 cell division protein ZapA [Pseudomonadota bacterium]MCG2771901.1 cell division protein ZapA [Desulfobacterales bacterium]